MLVLVLCDVLDRLRTILPNPLAAYSLILENEKESSFFGQKEHSIAKRCKHKAPTSIAKQQMYYPFVESSIATEKNAQGSIAGKRRRQNRSRREALRRA